MKVIGWTGCYTSNLPIAPYSENRKNALVECIKHRHYNFNFFDWEYLDCTALYDDGKICFLTLHQFEEVFKAAYAEIPMGNRLTPQDAIKDTSVDGIWFENTKLKKEYLKSKRGESNG